MNEELVVNITVPGKNGTQGKVFLQTWSKGMRSVRAIKFAAMMLIAAVASVFIPILHFFLVPAFIIATPLVGLYFYRQQSIIVGGVGQCPKCLADFTIVRSAPRWPLDERCDACLANVSINKTN